MLKLWKNIIFTHGACNYVKLPQIKCFQTGAIAILNFKFSYHLDLHFILNIFLRLQKFKYFENFFLQVETIVPSVPSDFTKFYLFFYVRWEKTASDNVHPFCWTKDVCGLVSSSTNWCTRLDFITNKVAQIAMSMSPLIGTILIQLHCTHK